MEKKYKILLVSETFPPDVNGAAVFVERLSQMLCEIGHEILVFAPSPTNEDGDEIVEENLKIVRFRSVSLKPIHPYFRAIRKLGLNKKAEKTILDFKPDIIHIHNHFLLGRACLKIAKKNNIPIMGTNHFMPDNLTEYFPKILEKPFSYYMWKNFIKQYNQLDYVTAPTHVALNMIKDLGLQVPSEVISNGIDLKDFQKSIPDHAIYEKFKLDSKRPIFLFVGRLERDKNIDLILSSIDLIRDKSDFQMVIVGRGKDEKTFKKLAEELKLMDRVTFAGRVSDEDLRQFYAIANIYIGSGSAELQGIAVMEAMAKGLPILAANAVALPELVQDGVNGYLFELNPESLAGKMMKILEDSQRIELMAQASLNLIQKHSKQNTAKSFTEVYKRMARNQ